MAKRLDPIRSEIEIRGPVAAWVLLAHAYALCVPLALIPVFWRHGSWLAAHTDFPWLLPVAAAVLIAGSAFEISQNTADRWYLVPGLGSTGAAAVSDLLFNFCVVAGQVLLAIAFRGSEVPVLLAAVVITVAQPVLYVLGRGVFAPISAAGLMVAVLGYRVTADPVVFLSLPMAGLTLYFYTALLRTGAQVLHGCTTAAASSGLWFVVLALSGAAAGRTPVSWMAIAVVVALGAVLAIGFRPALLRLPASPRYIAEP